MIRKIILVIIIMFVSASQSFAIDGIRKGFVLGFGLGPSLSENLDFNNYDKYKYDWMSGNLFIGYSWDSVNVFLWESVSIFNISSSRGNSEGFVGLEGINWYHYSKPKARSLYTVVGAGRFVAKIEQDYNLYKSAGFGILCGGGYEFTKQLQLSLYGVGGKTFTGDFHSTHAMIVSTITLIIY